MEPPAQVEAETEDHTEARTEPSLSITPSPGRPGQSVVVSVSGGCTAPSATARSNVFTQNVQLSTGSAGVYTGTGTIRADARAGTHAVSVSCPAGRSTYSITVAGATTPERGVRAGAGGSYGVDTVCLVRGDHAGPRGGRVHRLPAAAPAVLTHAHDGREVRPPGRRRSPRSAR